MALQLVTRYDVVRSNRLRYLGLLGASIPELGSYQLAIKGYADAMEDMGGGIARVCVEYERQQCGRYFAISGNYRGASFQRFSRSVRNFLAVEGAVDVDMVNAAPTVLMGVLKKMGLPCPCLTDFVENYGRWMDRFARAGVRDPKTYKNVVLFGPVIHPFPGLDEWANGVRAELAAAFPVVSDTYRPVLDLAVARLRDHDGDDDEEEGGGKRRRLEGNLEGTFWSHLYQRLEGELLEAMDAAGATAGLWSDNVSWLHDGMMVLPLRPVGDRELGMLSVMMHDKTGIRVSLALKAKTPVLDLDVTKLPSEIKIYGEHKEAGEILAMSLDGLYVRDENAEYVREPRGLWQRSTKAVDMFFINKAIRSNMVKMVKDKKTEEWVEQPFTSKYEDARRVAAVARHMLIRPTHTDFARDVVLGGIRKLAFRDGYWEFTTNQVGRRGVYGRFHRGGSFDSFTRVDRDFPVREQSDVDAVYRDIIDPIFTNTEPGLKEVFLAAVARALAGDIDKVTYILHGPRNSGKSVLFQFFENALGSYCGTVPSSQFAVYDGNLGGDSFRQSGFMINAETARIIKLSELPPSNGKNKVRMDGSRIKAFQSMKEGVMARALHMMQRPYYSIGTGFFLMNDVPEFKPVDSMDRCQLFELPNEFVTAAEKEKDPGNPNKLLERREVEELIRSSRYINAIIHILLEAYRPQPITPLDSMIQSKEEATMGQGDEEYLQVIEVTMNPDDVVPFPDLKAALDKYSKIQDNANAMGRALKRVIENAFKDVDKTPPTMDQIKKKDQRRKSPTFRKILYRYIRLRPGYDGQLLQAHVNQHKENRPPSNQDEDEEEPSTSDIERGGAIFGGSYARGFNPVGQSQYWK